MSASSAERLPPTDVAIVGLGAAGGVAAHRLTAAGLRVVALEAGERVGPQDFLFDEISNEAHNVLGAAKINHEVPTWRSDAGREATTSTAGRLVSLMVNGVGGGTIHYAGQHFRLAPWHFRLRSASIASYGAGALPAGCTATDWPVGHDELAPYYDRIDEDLGISGAAGANPFEAPRGGPYPLPPLRRTGWTDLAAGAAHRLGLHPFPGPAAIRTEPYSGLPACTYCGFCNFSGCWADAKGSTYLTTIPLAEATGNLDVVTGARVVEIAAGADGRATGVVYLREGRAWFQPAAVVFLSAHTLENTRLLLLSTSKAHPDGIANDRGLVGRNAMSQMYVGVDGVFPTHALNRFGGSYAQCTSIDDYNADNFDHTELGFVGGACISAVQEAKPVQTALSTPPSVPRWGSEWKAWLKRNGNSVGRMIATAESLPYDDSMLDLDPTVRDRGGFPVVRMTYRLHQQEERRYDFLRDRMGEIFLEAGASETWLCFPKLPAAPFQSVFGATRMGDDPDDSVVDRWCFAHDTPNLAVVGASSFPTSSGYNPTATIQALALRTAERIVEEWPG